MRPPGTLSVVATPIGNLEDLTFRALRTLKEVDVIAAEDTRRTSKLLAHYEIAKPLISLHEHNEHQTAASIVARIRAGDHVALVSDAGTPGISDPGAYLVRLAREAGLRVTPIPGPSAITAALSVAGAPMAEFVFLGFPPSSGAARQHWFAALGAERRPVVFFEAPHRIARTLREMRLYLVEQQIFVCREISKIHEEFVVWPITDVDDRSSGLGEYVVVISPQNERDFGRGTERSDGGRTLSEIAYLTNNELFSVDSVVESITEASKLSPARLRNYLKKSKLAHKRRSSTT
jgi:16S rRNA (cytidine1402-2'-O)-methyltransferase